MQNTSPWTQLPRIDFYIDKGNKKNAASNHKDLVQRLLRESRSKNALVYIDGSKIDSQTGAGLFAFYKNQETSQNWRLGPNMEVYNAKLFDIAQAIQWGLNNNLHLHQHLWIFSDNQATIKRLRKTSLAPGQVLAN